MPEAVMWREPRKQRHSNLLLSQCPFFLPQWPWYALHSWFLLTYASFPLRSLSLSLSLPFVDLSSALPSVCLGVLSLIRAFGPSWRPTPLNSSMFAPTPPLPVSLPLHCTATDTVHHHSALICWCWLIFCCLPPPPSLLLLLPCCICHGVCYFLQWAWTVLAFTSISSCKCEVKLHFCCKRSFLLELGLSQITIDRCQMRVNCSLRKIGFITSTTAELKLNRPRRLFSPHHSLGIGSVVFMVTFRYMLFTLSHICQ